MDAAFELHAAEHARAIQLRDDLLVAAHFTFGRGDKLHLPAALGGIALVHAPEVACEQGGFIAARAAAHLDDGRAIVVAILGQQHELHLALDVGQLRLDLGALLDRHVDEVAVGAGVFDQLFGFRQLVAQLHHFARLLGDTLEFRVIARELDDFLGVGGHAHARLDLLEAVDHLTQAGFRQVGHAGPLGKAPHMGQPRRQVQTPSSTAYIAGLNCVCAGMSGPCLHASTPSYAGAPAVAWPG